jgi:hypothetical protein
MKLDAWLRKTPQPVAILADDKRIEVAGLRWKDLAQTIEALAPSKVTCLNAAGGVIRAQEMSSAEEDAKSAPAETSHVVFARLIAEAYQRGATANQPILDNAMNMIASQATTISRNDREIDRLRAHILKLQGQILELQHAPEGDGEGGIMAAVAQGLLAAQNEQAAGATPINKAKAKP